MQIYLRWTCRECGEDQDLRTDTANYGTLNREAVWPITVNEAEPYSLRCLCGHISGVVGMGYEYKTNHRPSHERNQDQDQPP